MAIFKKKIKIKDNCSIDGVVLGKRLGPGLYVVGKNIDEATFEALKDPKFAHAVEQYVEKPEELAEVKDAPVDPYEKAKKAREEAKAKSSDPASKSESKK